MTEQFQTSGNRVQTLVCHSGLSATGSHSSFPAFSSVTLCFSEVWPISSLNTAGSLRFPAFAQSVLCASNPFTPTLRHTHTYTHAHLMCISCPYSKTWVKCLIPSIREELASLNAQNILAVFCHLTCFTSFESFLTYSSFPPLLD